MKDETILYTELDLNKMLYNIFLQFSIFNVH